MIIPLPVHCNDPSMISSTKKYGAFPDDQIEFLSNLPNCDLSTMHQSGIYGEEESEDDKVGTGHRIMRVFRSFLTEKLRHGLVCQKS